VERLKVIPVLLLAVMLVATPSRSQGTVYRVGPGRPLTTIQQAVILANNGDLLLVDPGT